MPHQCTGCGHTFEDGSKEMLSGCPECGGNKFQFRPEGTSLPEDSDTSETDVPSTEPQSRESSVAETVGRATTRVRDFVSSDSARSGASPDSVQSGPDTEEQMPDSAPDPNAEWPSEADTGGDTGTVAGGEDTGPTAGDVDTSLGSDDPSASGAEPSDGEIIDADARREARLEAEDKAQSSARSDVVSRDELETTANSDSESGINAPESPAGSDAATGPKDNTGTAPDPTVSSDGEVVSEPTGEDPDIDELREQLNDQFESIKILEPGQYELNLMELYDREEYIIALQENGRYVIQVPEQWIGEDLDDR